MANFSLPSLGFVLCELCGRESCTMALGVQYIQALMDDGGGFLGGASGKEPAY